LPNFWPDELSDRPFEDIGSHHRPDPYDDCRDVKCVVCKAPAGKRCVNPITRKPRKVPCIGRVERTTPKKEQR
jgi:hypothetical protein